MTTTLWTDAGRCAVSRQDGDDQDKGDRLARGNEPVTEANRCFQA
jgi:hypothetical protein